MSQLNPYADALGNRDPLTVLASTPEALSHAIDLHAATADARPAPGRWSPREIVSHLADAEIVHALRLRQALSQPHHQIQPFDQDAWALRYAAYDLPAALATFLAGRRWTMALVASLEPADFRRPLTHPERGTMTVQVLLETFAGHDLVHLHQLDRTWAGLEGTATGGRTAP